MEDEILEVIQELGEEVFDESQRLCPEGSGWLRNSGQLIPTMGGFEIIYEAPHARLIHDGRESREDQFYIQKVKRHDRRLRGGTITSVRDHEKKFFGRRPRLNPETGEWKVVSTTAGTPQPFIDDAYSKVIKRKKYKDIGKELGLAFPAKLGRGRQEILRRFLSI